MDDADHPVQFESVTITGTPSTLSACLLCGALIANTDEWRTRHRANHDRHNEVHRAIETEARSYKPTPTYG